MRIEDCFQLGVISRTHGKNGALVFKLDTDQPEAYKSMESVLLEENGELVPFFISEINPLKTTEFQVFLEDIEPGSANQYVGKELFLPLSVLPPLQGKRFYFHELVGFKAIDTKLGNIGTVSQVIERHPQHVIEIIYQECEIYIPAIDDFIVSINRKEKSIEFDCPDGLIDIYLE